MEYVVYLLVNSCNNCTYVGITNNKKRRLRQHNGELVGGAKYTKMKKESGEWSFYGFIHNLDKKLSLSIEKKIHIQSKKTRGGTPLERRIKCINKILENYPELSFIPCDTLISLSNINNLDNLINLEKIKENDLNNLEKIKENDLNNLEKIKENDLNNLENI
jgi:predicted GIY-YIG superfamily endonuclease